VEVIRRLYLAMVSISTIALLLVSYFVSVLTTTAVAVISNEEFSLFQGDITDLLSNAHEKIVIPTLVCKE